MIILFGLTKLTYGDHEKENDLVKAHYHYLSEDQDLIMFPSAFDSLAIDQVPAKEAKPEVKSNNNEKDMNAINIYQSTDLTNKDGLISDETLFFDSQKNHLKEGAPKEEESRYMNAILMASLMDELHL